MPPLAGLLHPQRTANQGLAPLTYNMPALRAYRPAKNL